MQTVCVQMRVVVVVVDAVKFAERRALLANECTFRCTFTKRERLCGQFSSFLSRDSLDFHKIWREILETSK
jgi:hypothetical protein